MCNLSWTPHSNLEKDNSLNHSCVSPVRWAVWSIHNYMYYLKTVRLLRHHTVSIVMIRCGDDSLPLSQHVVLAINAAAVTTFNRLGFGMNLLI